MAKTRNIKDLIEELIDRLEDEYGAIEAFECTIEHPIDAGMRDLGKIKEFNISYLHKEEIKI